MSKYILLDDEDFKKLTKGDVIEKDGVKIALQDIGYNIMFDILDENYDNFLNNQK